MSTHNNARLWAAIICGGSYGDAGEFLEERFRLRGPEDQGYFTVGFRLAESVSAANSITKL